MTREREKENAMDAAIRPSIQQFVVTAKVTVTATPEESNDTGDINKMQMGVK